MHVFATSGQRGAVPVTQVKQLLLLDELSGATATLVGILEGGAVMIDIPCLRHDVEAVKVSVWLLISSFNPKR
jgi:hypothetical protein